MLEWSHGWNTKISTQTHNHCLSKIRVQIRVCLGLKCISIDQYIETMMTSKLYYNYMYG